MGTANIRVFFEQEQGNIPTGEDSCSLHILLSVLHGENFTVPGVCGTIV